MEERKRAAVVLEQRAYNLAAENLRQGASRPQIVSTLVDRGLDNDSATKVVSNVTRAKRGAHREEGRKNMLLGALWCLGGIVVTAITLGLASDGGRFVVAYGAIAFGGFQFIAGLIQFLRA